MPYKCFLIVETGEKWEEKTEHGSYSGTYWRRVDTGEVQKHIRDFPIGAMWRASWLMSEQRKSPDGWQLFDWDWDNLFEGPLHVKTPGGDWNIDSRASNCTRPDDRTHRCWCRHGEPPNLHVDKAGDTCSAGAGSIICGNYHGFLHHGYLTDGM